MDQIIKKTEIENLDFIPAGPVHPNASELLNNGVIKSFIDEVRNYYDYILIDNSPMGVVYDPIIVGVHADFNLVLLRLNYSKSEEIEAINKIGHDGILKRVMVAINGKKSSKGYGYYTDDKEETKETSWKHFEFDKVADTLISTIKRN
jgi:Mrp family chromosome partitioning ATPase